MARGGAERAAAMTMFQNLRRMMGPTSTLKIECEACGRRAEWTRGQTFTRLGADAIPSEVRRRLACPGCGRGGTARVWI